MLWDVGAVLETTECSTLIKRLRDKLGVANFALVEFVPMCDVVVNAGASSLFVC